MLIAPRKPANLRTTHLWSTRKRFADMRERSTRRPADAKAASVEAAGVEDVLMSIELQRFGERRDPKRVAYGLKLRERLRRCGLMGVNKERLQWHDSARRWRPLGRLHTNIVRFKREQSTNHQTYSNEN